MFRIGVDVGGTFTDFTVFDEKSGAVHYAKVASTPADPSAAIEAGLAGILADHEIAPRSVSHLGHGTTIATNMVVERRGTRSGLLTTRGFRDVLEIGRQSRPHLYDYTVDKPLPLVERECRLEIDERVGPEGDILRPLKDRDLNGAVRRLKKLDVNAVAVCFLHSYRMADHERRARDALKRLFPQAYVSVSSNILPEFREFERLSTTVVNAYIGPRMQTYLDRFVARVRNLGLTVEPHTIQSNGGLMSIASVRVAPVRTCLSGPAAGVVGAAEVARAAGFRNLVTFDVGGTSTDVSLVSDLKPLMTSNRAIADYPVKVPMIDIHVIGAGGGSIAWMDDAGALKVGPRSAGADPGPAAYGAGGTEATLTDANICLRRLNPVSLLGGRMPVDEAAARHVVEKNVARPAGLDLAAAAHGILRIAIANMSRAIRSVSTEKGYDIKEFALFAYGGAGPLHAAEIALECNIPRVVVPQEPGTMCARGMLLTDVSFDFVRSEIKTVTKASWRRALKLFDDMVADGNRWLDGERVPARRRRFVRTVEARYQGQNYEVKVPLAPAGQPHFSDSLPISRKATPGSTATPFRAGTWRSSTAGFKRSAECARRRCRQ